MKPQSVATQRDTALIAMYALLNRLGYGDLFGPWDAMELSDWWDYRTDRIEQLLDRVVDDVDDGRVVCPLCGGSASNRHGYAYPHGLRWHLSGWRGMVVCSVIRGIAVAFEQKE